MAANQQKQRKHVKNEWSAETVKRFALVTLGSIFIQVFCWAMYSYFEMRVFMCLLSAVVTAMLYHFLQVEENTGLSRKNVFFATIVSPFAISSLLTLILMLRHRNLQHLGAELDGVSPLTELISLYATRLMINGVLLLIFALIHRNWLRNHPPAENKKYEK